MKYERMRWLALALTLALLMGALAGCGGEETPSTSGETEVTQEPTETTETGLLGENGKRLKVDYETTGSVAPEAASINSATLVINGQTLQMPFTVSALTENGWHFYSEDSGQQLISANTQASVMGFTLYWNDTPYLDLSGVRNDSAAQKPLLECTVDTLIMDLNQENMAELEFVLPGGITKDSTAADVLAVYGDVMQNEAFDHVQVGNTMLYYVDNEQTGLSFYFGFRDDGTLKRISISF